MKITKRFTEEATDFKAVAEQMKTTGNVTLNFDGVTYEFSPEEWTTLMNLIIGKRGNKTSKR